MNYENFTDKGLQMMHDGIHKAIAADSEVMKRGEPPPCRTSDTKDYRTHNGLRIRQADFAPIEPVNAVTAGNETVLLFGLTHLQFGQFYHRVPANQITQNTFSLTPQ